MSTSIFLQFHRDGTGEPFLIELKEIKGMNIQGIIVNGGEVVYTEEDYEARLKILTHSKIKTLIIM